MSLPNNGSVPYIKEYELNVSPKILFEYLSTPDGLAKWYADEVVEKAPGVLDLNWGTDESRLHLILNRYPKHVRYACEDGEVPTEHPTSFLDFKVLKSEVTQAVYLRVEDSTQTPGPDADEIWDASIARLREIVG